MTVNKIINQAIVNNYDGWYVLNIYPERATWAKTHLSSRLNRELHQRNLKEIKDLLQKNKISEIWGAWGDIDTKRKWLEDVKNDVIRTIKDTGVKIFYFDELTKKFNNPRHPLYIKIDFSKKRYL
jgi:serine/threonine protein phosphatase 1